MLGIDGAEQAVFKVEAQEYKFNIRIYQLYFEIVYICRLCNQSLEPLFELILPDIY